MNPEQVMKRCQVGTTNYNDANNLHAECYGTIGKLLHQQTRLIRIVNDLINCADINRDISEIREAKAFIRSIQP
jgi:hypothetical protein